MIKLTLPIEPVAKGRPRFDRRGIARTPEKTRGFERDVAAIARKLLGPNAPLIGPIALTARFVFVPGKSVKRKHHTIKPDVDNLIKAVADSLNGILWLDDGQIVHVDARKVYDMSGGVARIELEVEEVT